MAWRRSRAERVWVVARGSASGERSRQQQARRREAVMALLSEVGAEQRGGFRDRSTHGST